MSKLTQIEQRLVDNIEASFKVENHSQEDLMSLIRDISVLGISQRELAKGYLARAKELALSKLEALKNGTPQGQPKKPSGPTWN